MTIWLVASDIGSFNTIYPVGCCLDNMGYEINWQLSGKSIELFEKNDKKWVENKLSEKPKVIITGMSNNIYEYEIAIQWKDRCPIIAIPDIWSSPFFASGWKEGKLFPDIMCVNDKMGLAAVRSWGFNGWVIKTGWPMLDRYSFKIDRSQCKEKIRKKLSLTDETKIVFFIGQGEQENTEALFELLNVLAEGQFDFPVVVAPRQHLNTTSEEWERWNLVISGREDVVLKTDELSSEEVLLGADVVISDFSTMLTEAVVNGIPAISILYPGKPVVEKYSSWEWSNNTFPLATLGCCPVASNQNRLATILREALDGRWEKYFEAAKNVFYLKGNSQRVAMVVKGVLEAF